MDEKVLSELEELKKLVYEQTLLKKEVLSFKEAAFFMELSHSHLYYLIRKNKVPAYKPNDGKLYLKRVELVDWMVSKRRVSKREMKAMKMGIKSDCKSLDPEGKRECISIDPRIIDFYRSHCLGTKVPSTRDKSLDPEIKSDCKSLDPEGKSDCKSLDPNIKSDCKSLDPGRN